MIVANAVSVYPVPGEPFVFQIHTDKRKFILRVRLVLDHLLGSC